MLTFHVHGVMPPGLERRAQLERRIRLQMEQLGFGAGKVRTFEWRSGSPLGSAIAAGGLALLGGGLLGLGARAVWALASAGALGGAAVSYRAARLEMRAAAWGLTRALIRAGEQHERVHVVAHSLGTDLALRALEQLAARGRTLPGVVICTAGTARADRDYGLAARAAEQGIFNVHNPLDAALLAEFPVRWSAVVGRNGMRGAGVTNVETNRGHATQVGNFARVLAPLAPAGVRADASG